MSTPDVTHKSHPSQPAGAYDAMRAATEAYHDQLRKAGMTGVIRIDVSLEHPCIANLSADLPRQIVKGASWAYHEGK